MDRLFLEMVQSVMEKQRIPSDRAMSKELDQHENFISRIKNGVQSVPSSIWDAFIERFHIAQLNFVIDQPRIIYSQKHAINVVNDNHGTVTQGHTSISDCEKDLRSANEKIALLTNQLQDKERTIQILLNR